MLDFKPQHIYLDPAVKDLPVTKRILKYFSDLPITEVSERKNIKIPQQHSHAKKQLYLAKFQGQAIKSCQGMGNYVCCQYYTFSLVSDCHLECTYCILQDYLKNNPVITIYCNVDEIFEDIEKRLHKHPDNTFRLGSGELSDSLALDHITGFSKNVVDFANKNPNVVMELKTKTANIENLLPLKHNKNVVISWSINPQKYIQKEELKCDDLETRLTAARACADKGYPIGLHMDPLLYFSDWKEQYNNLILEVAKRFDSKEIAWISIGSLRFTPGLKKISQERFPKSKIMTGEMFPSGDGKTRYFRPLREEMYAYVSDKLKEHLGKAPHYLCMETKAVWRSVFNHIPESNQEVESGLMQNIQTPLTPSNKMSLLQFEV